MKTKITLLSAFAGLALLSSGSATAQSLSSIDWLGGWSGSASLSGLFTTGNSETTNISGSASVSKQINQWRHTAFGSNYTAKSDIIDSVTGDADSVETADRFDIGYKVDRQFNDKLYGFGRLRYDTDDFGNIQDRVSGVVGAGYRILDDGKQFLTGELGVGAHNTEFDRPLGSDPLGPVDPTAVGPDGLPITADIAGPEGALDDSGAVLYGGLNYSNILNEYLTFNSNFSFEAADINTLTVWDNSLNVSVSDSISLSFGILTRNNSDIEGQLGDNTDTATRVGIVFGI